MLADRIEKWRYGMVDDYLKEHEKYKQEETDAVAHFRAVRSASFMNDP